jgi:putative transposase
MNYDTSKKKSIIAKQSHGLFQAGMLVRYNGEQYKISTAHSEYLVLQDITTNKVLMLMAEQWQEGYCNGLITVEKPTAQVVVNPITDVSKLAEAERILAYINELETRPHPGSVTTREKVINYISSRIGDKNPPHEMQLYRWSKKWEKVGKNISAFINVKQSRIKPVTGAQLDFAMFIIDKYFMVKFADNRSALYRHYVAEFEKEANQSKFELSGKPMSKTALDNILDSLDPFEVTAAQKGLAVARNKYRDSNEKIVTNFPGERVEIDAVHLNLGLVDEDTGEYSGKVILFLAIDVHTRYILGYSIVHGLNPAESSEGAKNLLQHIVSPKLRNGNYINEWVCVGVPYCFHADNGPAFIAENTLRVCAMLNADLHRSESKKSQRRPFIERFNQTLREQLMVNIPGYLGKRLDRYNFEKTVEQVAVVSLETFTRYLEEYIVDYYHQNPHSGLDGLTPAQMMSQCEGAFFKRPAPDLAVINSLVGATFKRTIQATHGVQIENICYHSTQLKELRFSMMKNRKKEKQVQVEVIFNRNDISSVTVLVPGALESIIVPARDKTIQPGTRLAQYKATKAAATEGFEIQRYESIGPKHDAHSKSSKNSGNHASAPQSRVVEHEVYNMPEVLSEGTSRLATDDTARTVRIEDEVDISHANSRTITRKRSGSS